MITITPSSTSACSVKGADIAFELFPEKPVKGTYSLLAHPEEEAVEKVISWPGEYDFQSMTLRGIGQQQGKQVSYTAAIDGVRCGFIDAPLYDWSDAEVQLMGDIDVLVIRPDDQKKASALVEAIDPRVVIIIPAKKGADAAAVAKACGAKDVQTVSEFKAKAGSLPSDSRQVAILQ
jgi:hypothetical protein